MARPQPKNNFFQILLFAALVMLGFQLFTGAGQKRDLTYGDKVLKTRQEILTAMRDANAKGKDITIASQLLPAYEQSLREAKDKKEISALDEQRLKWEATVLVGHTQLSGGVVANDTNRVRNAFNTLHPVERGHQKDAVWNTPIEVTDPKQGPIQISGHELHEETVELLSERNKSDLIWGVIPGGYQLIDFLVKLTGGSAGFSYAAAAFLLAFVVRAVVFPLTQKQLMFSRQMSQLTPRLKEIKERYQDDQVQQQAKVMELYKEYGINPFMGCWPVMVQMPLFLTIYQAMLHYQFTFSKGTFLWINPDTSAATNGFVGANLGQNDYILIALYGISMVISTLLQPVSDPLQAKQQRLMGVGISVFFTLLMVVSPVPVVAGFVLYWTFTNILATAQSLWAYRLPMPPLVKVNAPGGGVYPGGTAKASTGRWAQMLEDMQRRAAEEQERIRQQNEGKDGGGSSPTKKSGPSGPDPKSLSSGKTGTPAKHKPKKRR